MTFRKKKILLVVKTYPNLSRKYKRVVCTAGIDLENNEWIRMFPLRFFKIPFKKRPSKFDIIEVKAEPYRDKFLRKESHKIDDDSIKKIGHIGTEKNWKNRNKILMPLLNKSVEELEDLYKKDKVSLGIIKPKEVTDLKIKPIEKCRDWERDLILGTQRTLTGTYKSPLDKIPYKFSYVFKCNDSRCNGHSIMVEDWELCQLFRHMNEKYGKKKAIEKVKEKYFDYFTKETNLHFFMGTESRWNKWIIIGVYYPKKKRALIKDKIIEKIQLNGLFKGVKL